jgi:hypothetical protein
MSDGEGSSSPAFEALAAASADGPISWRGQPELRRLPAVQALLEADDAARAQAVLDLFPAAVHGDWPVISHAHTIIAMVTRRRLALTIEQVQQLAEVIPDQPHRSERSLGGEATEAVLPALEHTAAGWSEAELTQIKPALERWAAAITYVEPIRRLKAVAGALDPLSFISDEDAVGPRLREAVGAAGEGDAAVTTLLDVLARYPGTKLSRRWVGELEAALDALGDPSRFVGGLVMAFLEAPDTARAYDGSGETYTYYASDAHETLGCSASRVYARIGGEASLEPLSRLARKSITVIGGEFGSPRSLRLANACVHAMAGVGGDAALRELLALERAVRHGSLLKEIRKAVETLAAARGMTRSELLERAVETHGLEAGGTRTVALSRGAALITTDGRSASLGFRDEHGKDRASFPAEVKQESADTLAALRDEVKALRKSIATHRHRLDGLLAEDRVWPVEDWKTFYLDHPLIGPMAKTLIWSFRGPDGAAVVGLPTGRDEVRMADGESVAMPQTGGVRLWHPVVATTEEIHAWRLRLLTDLVVQPIKQAFREIYRVTPAEGQSRDYSNRFAAHVFRQVQARALMKGRGWKPVALAWWDDGIDHGVARRSYEPFGIRAEFFFDPVHDVEPTGDLYPLCTSDQVRFVREADEARLTVSDVPLLLFTEAMRDVDLFVGVTSIGADPQWLDRGEGRRFETYWNTYSFGELSTSASVRREVLQSLIPKLAIADRLSLEDRFLRVRGQLRTYRIHLGSGNILMEPDDLYLCIVSARDGRVQRLFLPFDDDQVLSLILSKAFLLAADDTITDPTIRQQIG